MYPHHHDGSHTKADERDTLHQIIKNVLPLLAITKKYNLVLIHTSFINTAIDNMTDNIIIFDYCSMKDNIMSFLKTNL